jgi:hypothetical protein
MSFTNVIPDVDPLGGAITINPGSIPRYFAFGFNTGSATSLHIYATANPWAPSEERLVSLYEIAKTTNLLFDPGRVTDLAEASLLQDENDKGLSFEYNLSGTTRNAVLNNLTQYTTYIFVMKTTYNDFGGDVSLSIKTPSGSSLPLTYYKTQLALDSNGVTLDLNTIITLQPVAPTTTIHAGESFTLSVTAVGASGIPLVYQWFKNGVAIDGANSSSYVVVSPTTDMGEYYVRINDDVESNTVAVIVTTDYVPVITTQPTASTVATLGASVTLSVTAFGASGYQLVYQWFKNEVAIVDATSPTYHITSVTITDSGAYYVHVSYENNTTFYRDSNIAVVRIPIFTNVIPDKDPFGGTILINPGANPRYFGFGFNTESATSLNIYATANGYAPYEERLVSLYEIAKTTNLLFDPGRVTDLAEASLLQDENDKGLRFNPSPSGTTRNAVLNGLTPNTTYIFVTKTTYNDPGGDVSLLIETPTGESLPLTYYSTQTSLNSNGVTIDLNTIALISVSQSLTVINGKVTMVFSFTPFPGAANYKLLLASDPTTVLATSSVSPIQYDATASTTLEYYIVAYDAAGNQLTAYQSPALSTIIACLPRGTRVLTPDGLRLVEDFANGDLVLTDDGRAVPVCVHRSGTTCSDAKSAPVRIAARSFFGEYPVASIRVSSWHAFKVGTGNHWLLPKDVLDVAGVVQEPFGQAVEYYHFELPNYLRDNLVLEGGAFVESYGIPWKKASGRWGQATYIMGREAGYCQRIVDV